jgi:hypothetical protein
MALQNRQAQRQLEATRIQLDFTCSHLNLSEIAWPFVLGSSEDM